MRLASKTLLLCLAATSILAIPAAAQEEAYNPYGGGIIHGQILGFNIYDELVPVVWAEISAWRDGELVAKAYSMAGGYYEIILPVGWYTLKVEEPGYKIASMKIFVSSGSLSSINFVLELSGEPVYKPKPPPPPAKYTVQITVSGLPLGLKTRLYVDGGFRRELEAGEAAKLAFDVGTSHTVSVEERLERDGERYAAEEPSITVSSAAIHEFKYGAEYLLKFATEPKGLPLPSRPKEGWYPAGFIVTTPPAPALIEGPQGVRYRFRAWLLDGVALEGNPAEFEMDGPRALKAAYSTEYLLEVASAYGTPEGSGWYPAGSTATISVQPSVGFLVKRVFVGWSGDYVGEEPVATLTVDKPMRVTAVWIADYTPLAILTAIIAISAAASAVILLARRKAGR